MGSKDSGDSNKEITAKYQAAFTKKEAELHTKLDETISPFLRWTIFFVNVIFWAVGLLTMMLGIWAYLEKAREKKSKTIETAVDVIADIAIVFAIFGFIIFALAFAGCVGVLRQNIILLKFFRFVLMAILGLQILMIVGAVVFTTVSMRYIQNLIKVAAIARYRDDIDLQNIIDWIQLELKCCGVGNKAYLDWNGNKYFNCSESNPSTERCSVPFSCCIYPNDIDQEIINTRCAYKVLEKTTSEIQTIVFPYGCVSKINSLIKQRAVYAGLGLIAYVFCYCIVIDVIDKMIRQIHDFKNIWFKTSARRNTIEAISLTDLVEKTYLQKVAAEKTSGSINEEDVAKIV